MKAKQTSVIFGRATKTVSMAWLEDWRRIWRGQLQIVVTLAAFAPALGTDQIELFTSARKLGAMLVVGVEAAREHETILQALSAVDIVVPLLGTVQERAEFLRRSSPDWFVENQQCLLTEIERAVLKGMGLIEHKQNDARVWQRKI